MNNIGDFIRKRITDLRLQHNKSESLMSRELGHHSTYISNMMNKKQIPSIRSLNEICEYFGITMSQFFNEEIEYPAQVNQVLSELQSLSPKSRDVICLVTAALNELENP